MNLDPIYTADRNYFKRMTLLNAAHQMAVARLKSGHPLADVVDNLRDQYRTAEFTYPIFPRAPLKGDPVL